MLACGIMLIISDRNIYFSSFINFQLKKRVKIHTSFKDRVFFWVFLLLSVLLCYFRFCIHSCCMH